MAAEVLTGMGTGPEDGSSLQRAFQAYRRRRVQSAKDLQASAAAAGSGGSGGGGTCSTSGGGATRGPAAAAAAGPAVGLTGAALGGVAPTAAAAVAAGPGSGPGSVSDARKAQLRALFVAHARKYIGVPYARRPHDAPRCSCEGCSASGRQLGREPLHLDCCGLVRRVARDLQAQLGFRLGHWNQAYQFDCLPQRVASVQALQPGDLIFYSGHYYSAEPKRQHFDMTHVEVFVGGATGMATIGSRERHKWVMEYPSFEFESQRWQLAAYHYCKLDPWLEGVCQPQHPELWQQGHGHSHHATHQQQQLRRPAGGPRWDGRRFSVFAKAQSQQQQQQEQDESDGES